jgi:hypothetical protein
LELREPTDGMLVAGLQAGYESNIPAAERVKKLGDLSWAASNVTAGDGRLYAAAYRAMIDAALGINRPRPVIPGQPDDRKYSEVILQDAATGMYTPGRWLLPP